MSVGYTNNQITLEQVRAGSRYYEFESPTTKSSGVATVQQYLKDKGYFSTAEVCDGMFGPKTLAQVKTFQIDKGLTIDGYIGKNTLAALESRELLANTGNMLRKGDSGEAVKALQEKLFELKYDCRTPNEVADGVGVSKAFSGVFSAATEWAVKWFQTMNSLSADGIVGSATQNKLNDSPVSGAFNWSKGGTPPRYRLGDSLWGKTEYHGPGEPGTISTDGCGPASLATVISALTGYSVIPPILASWMVENGYKSSSGTSPGGITACAKKYGIAVTTDTTPSFDTVTKCINDGGLVLAGVNSRSPYTNNAHYVCIHRLSDGNVYVTNSTSNQDVLTEKVWRNGGIAYRYQALMK